MNDFSKERDAAQKQNELLKQQAKQANADLEAARHALVLAKQESESRVALERQQRDAAKANLEARLEAVRDRKSKFAVRSLIVFLASTDHSVAVFLIL